MKRITLLAALFLAACAPRAPQVALPQFLPSATPYIDPSYPTAQANVALPNQTVSGIDVHMDTVWQDGKNINANICFTMVTALGSRSNTIFFPKSIGLREQLTIGNPLFEIWSLTI